MVYGWWYTVAAVPAFVVAVSVFLLMTFAVRLKPGYSVKLFWLLAATLPGILTFPAFRIATNLQTNLAQLSLLLAHTPQQPSDRISLSIGARLNTLALWALIGTALTVPLMWTALLVGEVLPAGLYRRRSVRTISNVATRAFGRCSGAGTGRLRAQHGTLTINSGQKKGAIEAVRPHAVIGAKGDIQINDSGVSRSHAGIRIEGDQVLLTDLDSTNGTYLKRDKQVLALDSRPIALRHGDLIYLGDPALPTSIELVYQKQEARP